MAHALDSSANAAVSSGYLFLGLPVATWAILVPAIIALITLLVQNITALRRMRQENKLAIQASITLARRQHLLTQLKEFYSPILAALSVNGALFSAFGPPTWPEDEDVRSEAVSVWGGIVENIILRNNAAIYDIIRSGLHLLCRDDKMDVYLEFCQHAESFRTFSLDPHSRHWLFPFPKELPRHVAQHKAKLQQEVDRLDAVVK